MKRVVMLVLAAACGAPPPVQDVHIATLATSTPPRVPPVTLGVPHDAAFVMSFDLGAAMRIQALRKALARPLDVSEASLESGLDGFGFDTSRPVTVAVLSVSSDQRKLIDEMMPLTATQTPTAGTDQAITHVLATNGIAFRVLFPATDVGKVEHAVGALLEHDAWTKRANGFTKRRQSIVMTDDGKTVALDVGGMHPATSIFTDVPPALDGRVLRATWAPSRVANAGFMAAVTQICEVLMSDGVIPSQRTRIAAEGFYEAGQVFPLGSFDRVDVDLRLEPFELTMRAVPSSTFALPDAAAFTPSTSITTDALLGDIETTTAFRRAWTFPGGNVKAMTDMVRDAGAAAWLVALPHIVASGLAPFLDQPYVRHGPDNADLLARFDRAEEVWLIDQPAPFIGILPAGTSRASAECVFEPHAPCDAKSRLKLGGVVSRFDHTLLFEMDHRFVVMTGEASSLKVKVTSRTVSPIHVEVMTGPLAPLIFGSNPFPPHLVGDVTTDSGAFVYRMVAVTP